MPHPHAHTAGPPRPWPEAQRRLREHSILDAAAELFASHGYATTSMDELAARVGVSKPTLYQHFPSKEDVARSVMLRRMRDAADRLAAAEADIEQGAAPRPRLERYLRDQLAQRLGLWASRLDMPRSVTDNADLNDARERVWARVGAIVDRCRAEGSCRDDTPTAVVVRHLTRVFRDDYADLIAGGVLSADELAVALVSLVFDGVTPRAGHATASGDTGLVAGDANAAAPAAVSGRDMTKTTTKTTTKAATNPDAPAIPRSGPRIARRAMGIAALALGRAAAVAAIHSATARTAAAQPASAPAAPATPAGAAGRPLTLADVLDAALRANPTERVAFAEARAASAQYSAARASWFPTLSFTPTVTRAQTLSGAAGSATTPGDPVPTTRTAVASQRLTYGPSVGLSYLLFDLGGRAATVSAARANARSASSTRDAAVQTTILQAETAYFGYQSARAVTESQDANVQTATASNDATVARFRAGLATVADTLQTATALAQARLNALSARTDLANARGIIATVMGARADFPFTIAAEPAPDAAGARAATAALASRVDTLVTHALRRRPDVAAARDETDRANAEVRAARSARLPSVAVSATGGRTISNISTLEGPTYSVQAGLSFPFFDGGARRADEDAARALADVARARSDAVSTGAVNEVVSAADVLRLAADRVATAEQLLTSAERAEEVARGRYTEGVGDVVALLTAQNALATARSQAAQARWGWATALAQLARNAGILGARGQLPAVAAPAVPPTSLPSTPPAR